MDMKKLTKKLTKKHIKRQCDNYASLIARSKGYCEVCGNVFNQLQAHHVISRNNHRLRWDLKNLCCLCSSCHKFSNTSAHQNPVAFLNWFKQVRPDDYDYLNDSKWNQTKVLRLNDYQEIYNNLKEIYEKINN